MASHHQPGSAHRGVGGSASPAARGPLLFISAAEQSADQHGASLIRAVLRAAPDAQFVGVAGPRMRAAGCRSIFDMTRHAAMLLGALGSAGQAIRMLNTSDAYLRRLRFDAAVVIDSPTLHLPLAARAQAAGVPVLYYIAPQMWAWGGWRIHKLRGRVEKTAVILPFEERFFRDQGVDARYVGHPLVEQMASRRFDEGMVAALRGGGGPLVALLPGSRRHVVEEVLRGQLETAQRIAAAVPGVRFGVSVANAQVAPVVQAAVARAGKCVTMVTDGHGELIRAADLVLAASGTTTLEVAWHRKPMIIMYNASPVFYHLVARWVLKTPLLSLPNILAGREIVPEFMPYYTSTAPIAARAIELLRDEGARQRMSAELGGVIEGLGTGSASGQAARMLLDMAAARRH